MPPNVVFGNVPVSDQFQDWNVEVPFGLQNSPSWPNLYDEATTLNHGPHITQTHHSVNFSLTTATSTPIPASAQSGPGEEQGAADTVNDNNGESPPNHEVAPATSGPSHVPAYSQTSVPPSFTTVTSNPTNPTQSPSPQHTSAMDSESPPALSTTTTAPHSHHSATPPAIPQQHPHSPGNAPPTGPPLPGGPMIFEFPLNPSYYPTATAHDLIESLLGGQPAGGPPQPLNMPLGLTTSSPAVPFSLAPHILQSPTPGVLTPQNIGLLRFLSVWVGSEPPPPIKAGAGTRGPTHAGIVSLTKSTPNDVNYRQLRGDKFDLQGIDWSDLQVTRKEARTYRLRTYRNFVNIAGSDKLRPGDPDIMLPNSESYFRFRHMHIRRKSVRLSHFQLRHILASSTRNRSFYPGVRGIRQINPLSGKDESMVDLTDLDNGGVVSTLAASNRLLVAGTFNGEYCIKNLESSEPGQHHTGRITESRSGITTHVQVYSSRSSGAPVAAFASNDRAMRTLDITTGKFLMEAKYNLPVNCAVLSPDKRLRLMVGDDRNAVIANAETGEVLREIGSHRDNIFACDWADDGWTVATGSQDMAVKIWDARRWCNSRGEGTPVTTLRSEMAGVRSLKFSPLGSGKRVLVAAEEADFVNIIDARSFGAKQTLDIFGEIGGIDFCDGGGELQVLCCDSVRGGLMRFDRCDWGREAAESGSGWESGDSLKRGSPRSRAMMAEVPEGGGFDWGEGESRVRRRKRAARSVHLEPF